MSRPSWALTGLLLALAAASAHAQSEVAALINTRVDHLRNGAKVVVSGRTLASRVVLPDFYERRGYEPAWTAPARIDELLAVVQASRGDGLSPEDYHASTLDRLRTLPAVPMRDADLDLLATDAVVRLAYHLRYGKIDPTRIDRAWNFRPDFEGVLATPPTELLEQAIAAGRLHPALDRLRPQQPLYAALRAALVRYRAIEAAGGWPPVPAGPTLKPGDVDPRVPILRQRLATEDAYAAAPDTLAATPTTYGRRTAEAVRRFQSRNGLTADGVLGARTLGAINKPVADRIAKLRLALERGRLLLHDLPAEFVVVNIPSFRALHIEDNAVRLASNVVVGKPYTRTPVFRAEINQVVINPSWTIPPGIMQRDVIPGMRKDPDYLRKKGFRQVDGRVVQPPGPNNALGRLKINFPNPHLVYLHDTPQRDLFNEDARAFSSGCIRVDRIVELASLVLDDPERWPESAIRTAIDSGRTQFIEVTRTLPVLLLYWTAVAGVGDEDVYFYDDVYKRDAAELAALDGPFTFDQRAVTAARNRPRP